MTPVESRDPARTAELRKAVFESAQGVVTGERAIIAACRELATLGHSIVEDWRVDADFRVFGAVNSETDREAGLELTANLIWNDPLSSPDLSMVAWR